MNSTVIKGAALGLIAIIVGVLALTIALDDPDETSSDTTTTTEAVETTTTVEGDGSATSTTVATPVVTLRAPSEVTFVVANGTDVDGVAGAITDTLKDLGYPAEDPHNASSSQTSSRIYYFAGWQAEATVIAEALNIPAARLSEFVLPIPVPFALAEVDAAKVVIVLGGPDILFPQSETTSSETTS